MVFFVDNPEGDKVTGKIFDLRGNFVANLTTTGDPTSTSVILEWNGRRNDNDFADKGVYIYQIESSGKVNNGTVIVAR